MRMCIVPSGWPVGLHECPPGIFCAVGRDGPDPSCLGFKTEYHQDDGATAAYVLASGETWWGGATTKEQREAQLVMPCDIMSEEVMP